MLFSCDGLFRPVDTTIINLNVPRFVDSTICSADFAQSFAIGASGHYFVTSEPNRDSDRPHDGAAKCLIDDGAVGPDWRHHRMRKTRVSF